MSLAIGESTAHRPTTYVSRRPGAIVQSNCLEVSLSKGCPRMLREVLRPPPDADLFLGALLQRGHRLLGRAMIGLPNLPLLRRGERASRIHRLWGKNG